MPRLDCNFRPQPDLSPCGSLDGCRCWPSSEPNRKLRNGGILRRYGVQSTSLPLCPLLLSPAKWTLCRTLHPHHWGAHNDFVFCAITVGNTLLLHSDTGLVSNG